MVFDNTTELEINAVLSQLKALVMAVKAKNRAPRKAGAK